MHKKRSREILEAQRSQANENGQSLTPDCRLEGQPKGVSLAKSGALQRRLWPWLSLTPHSRLGISPSVDLGNVKYKGISENSCPVEISKETESSGNAIRPRPASYRPSKLQALRRQNPKATVPNDVSESNKRSRRPRESSQCTVTWETSKNLADSPMGDVEESHAKFQDNNDFESTWPEAY